MADPTHPSRGRGPRPTRPVEAAAAAGPRARAGGAQPRADRGGGPARGVVLLGVWGDDLAAALVAPGPRAVARHPVAVGRPGRGRRAAPAPGRGRGGAPGAIVAGRRGRGDLAAHQVQVGGLWVPGLLAPDPARLWAGGAGRAWPRGGRGASGACSRRSWSSAWPPGRSATPTRGSAARPPRRCARWRSARPRRCGGSP